MLRTSAKPIMIAVCMVGIIAALAPDGLRDAFSNLIVQRFQVSEDGFLEGDTRYIEYSSRYSEYLRTATASELAFGHGARSNQLDERAHYASYQGIVYEGGFFGLLLVALFSGYLLLAGPLRAGAYSTCALCLFPMLSLYQRPDFLSAYFIVMYVAVYFTSTANHPGSRARLSSAGANPVGQAISSN
jgi:hypothetical protein